MDNYFIPEEQALELNWLGFDEPCIKVYHTNKSNDFIINDTCNVSAPLWKQAFDWFRKTYELSGEPHSSQFGFGYNIIYDTLGDNQCKAISKGYESFEEAELECLKQLIIIAKS